LRQICVPIVVTITPLFNLVQKTVFLNRSDGTTSTRLSTAYQGPAEGTAEGEDRATRAAMADQATLEVGQVMADLLLRLGWACRRAGAEKAQRAAGAVRLAHASLKSLDRGSAWWSSGSAGAWCGSTALPTMGQVCAPVCCCLPPWPCAQPRGCALVFPSPALWRGPHIPARLLRGMPAAVRTAVTAARSTQIGRCAPACAHDATAPTPRDGARVGAALLMGADAS
jgi:hypothetical protein